MKEQLIQFKTSFLAKKKGFDWPCTHVHGFNMSNSFAGPSTIDEFSEKTPKGFYSLAPTQSLLQKWLREEHRIFCWASFYIPPNRKDHDTINSYVWTIFGEDSSAVNNNYYSTYEEALEVGLYNALKLITDETDIKS